MRIDADCAVNRITRIQLIPLLLQNGCSQSSRFPTACQLERSSGNETVNGVKRYEDTIAVMHKTKEAVKSKPEKIQALTGFESMTCAIP